MKSFASPKWSDDPPLTREMRSIFNACLKYEPKQNRNVFGKDLVFDENANKITLWMSMHIITSFSNDPWSADPPLT